MPAGVVRERRVTSSGVQAGSATVAGLPSEPASRTAVTGRQKFQCFFSAKQAISESAFATSAIANIRAVCRVLSRRVWATCRLISHSVSRRSCHQIAASV